MNHEIDSYDSYREIEITISDIFNNTMHNYTLLDVLNKIEKYKNWVTDLKEEFCISKSYNLEHIAEQVFSDTVFDKNSCKMHILAFELAVDEIYKELSQVFEQDSEISISEHFIKGKLSLLRDVILDINELICQCKEIFLNQPQTRKLGRRRLFDSREVFLSSKNLLRRHFYYDDISFSSISVFLIRQSIELKVLNCLGVYSIVDKEDKPQKFKLEKVIEFIEQSDEIEFPVKKSLLLKITKWTNAYVHRGIMHYHWQIVFVQNILLPLFKMGEGKTMMSIYGAVKIDKEYFETELHKDLLKYLGFETDKVKICRIKEEAIVE